MPAIDDRLTIDPPPLATIAGIAYLIPKNTPVALTAMIRCQRPEGDELILVLADPKVQRCAPRCCATSKSEAGHGRRTGPHSAAAMRHSLHGFVMHEAASTGQLKPDCRYLGPGIVALTIWQPWATLIIEGRKPSSFAAGIIAPGTPSWPAGALRSTPARRRIRRDEVAGLLCRLERKHSRVSDAALPPLPERARKRGMLTFAHIPTGTTVNRAMHILMLRKSEALHQPLHRHDRSRHRNRQGYTLRSGSGCLANWIHLKQLYSPRKRPSKRPIGGIFVAGLSSPTSSRPLPFPTCGRFCTLAPETLAY